MLGNFLACLSVTLRFEGGFVNHPRDPGGATNKGVTLATLRRYVPGASVADLKAIPDELLDRIYKSGFWSPVKGDDLPLGVDLAVFDYAVNSGPSRAIKAWSSVSKEKTYPDMIRAVCSQRLSFMRALAIWATFGRGWGRRVGEVEAAALRMAFKNFRPAIVDSQKEAATNSAKKARVATQVGAGGVAAQGGHVVPVDQLSADPAALKWFLLAVGVSLAVVALAAFIASRGEKNRADALNDALEEG